MFHRHPELFGMFAEGASRCITLPQNHLRKNHNALDAKQIRAQVREECKKPKVLAILINT